jgi:hypothetical protein
MNVPLIHSVAAPVSWNKPPRLEATVTALYSPKFAELLDEAEDILFSAWEVAEIEPKLKLTLKELLFRLEKLRLEHKRAMRMAGELA